jgi:two-component system chemotaxis response regulator CheY
MEYIVLIDDSLTTRMSVQHGLRHTDYHILHFEKRLQAIEKIDEIKKGAGEVVLCALNINISDVNDIELIKELKEIDKAMPIIVLTDETSIDMTQKGKEAGVSGWLIKPFKPAEFADVAMKLIR